MLKVKIESIVGFGKTAEFATIHLMHYDLSTGASSAMVNLYEVDPLPGSPASPAVPLMSKHIECAPADNATWGTDDMVFVDTVLGKAGVVRDTEWVQPEPEVSNPAPEPELP